MRCAPARPSGHFLKRSLISFFSLVLGLLGTVSALAQDDGDDSLKSEKPSKDVVEEVQTAEPPPVKRIVMFNSGLSQIVHEGKIEGNRRVNMRFSGHDVDDVLKSLVFEDANNGTVRSVEYNPAPDNKDVAAQNLGPAMTLAQTLQKYRGEIVEIKTGVSTLKGAILSVENRQSRDTFIETLTIVNEQGFVSIALNDFESINFENEKLRDEFQLAMAGLQKTRLASSKEISLFFEGEGERDVRFSYNVDAPIWRMTYRLDLAGGKSLLQGWAHIDNVTGVDWNEITLDLRSGRPQSFHVELFAPVLAERTGIGLSVFDIPSDKTLMTKFANRGLGGLRSDNGGGFGGGGFGGGFGGGGRDKGLDINSAIQAAGQVGRSNKMVRFEIKEPVTLGAGRSAMVPVLKQGLEIDLFSMFDGAKIAEGARLVAQLRNDGEIPLIPGPVTLYQQGDFVGDGVFDRIEVGQTAELIYGADLAVEMKVINKKTEMVVNSVELDSKEAKITETVTSKTVYQFKNDDALARQFLLRAPLVESNVEPKPIRREGGVGFYSIDCDAKTDVELTITQTRVDEETMPLNSINQELIDTWNEEEADLDAALLAKMKSIFEAKQVVASIEEERSGIVARISSIQNEQERVTGIIKVLPTDSPALEKYLDGLSESENELAKEKEAKAKIEQRLKNAREKLELELK